MKLIIKGEPVAKARPRVCKWGTYTPEKTVNYETLVKEMFVISKQKRLEGQLRMEVLAYFSIPKSTSKKKHALMLDGTIRPVKRPDWDNIGKIVSDALNKLAYNDDSQIVTAYIEKWYSDQPRVEIYISEVYHAKIKNTMV